MCYVTVTLLCVPLFSSHSMFGSEVCNREGSITMHQTCTESNLRTVIRVKC